jgi:hypothetical protein
MKFKRIWNIIVQSSAIVGQTVVPTLPVNEEVRSVIHASIAAVQGVAAVIAHNANPDGTSATTAYREPPQTFDNGER